MIGSLGVENRVKGSIHSRSTQSCLTKCKENAGSCTQHGGGGG